MSEFFKALEQADRDRALASQGRAAEAPAPAAETPVETPEPARLPPRPVVEPPAPALPRPVEARRAPRPEAPAADDGARDGIDGHMVSLLSPNTFEAEQYRTLRHLIEELHESAHVSIIACTSPAGGDGKTTSSINLAGALAQAPNTKVLLVDADLRRPSVARELTLGDDAGPGLVGALVNRALRLEDVVRRRPPFTLSILPAGTGVANPYELLKSPRFAELMEAARRQYDYVVLDTPPVVAMPDCRAIAPCIDGFLLIVSAHRTPRRLVEEALNAMELAKVIGLVFNRDDRPLGGYYTYGTTYSAPASGARGWRRAVEGARNVLRRKRVTRRGAARSG